MGSPKGAARTGAGYGVAGDDSWMTQGACADASPDTLFPVTEIDQEDAAASWCADCPVQLACLQHSLDNHIDHGVWGGTSEAQRRTVRRRMRNGATLDVALQNLPVAKRPTRRRGLPEESAAILDLAREHPDGINAGHVARHLDTGRPSASRRLHHLVDKGHLYRVERGLFALVKEEARA